jgi:hypothetical protein
MTMNSRLRLAVGFTCALAALAPAAASRAGEQTAPSFLVRPVLVRSAGGAFVHYQLDRAAVHSDLVIDGTTGHVRNSGKRSEAVYDGFVKDGSLRAGHYYRVSVTVTSRTGGVASRRELLYLHRSFPRP